MFADNNISHIVKLDLQQILARFIKDSFQHNLDLISPARQKFRPQTPNVETVLADKTDYVRDPECAQRLPKKNSTHH